MGQKTIENHESDVVHRPVPFTRDKAKPRKYLMDIDGHFYHNFETS